MKSNSLFRVSSWIFATGETLSCAANIYIYILVQDVLDHNIISSKFETKQTKSHDPNRDIKKRSNDSCGVEANKHTMYIYGKRNSILLFFFLKKINVAIIF